MATPTWVAEKATGYLRDSGYKAGTLFGIVPKNNITSNFNPDGSWLSWKAPYIPNGFDFTFTRNSVANRINSAGLLEEMAVDVPRIQYPTCPSVLLEPARTNLSLWSEAFDHTSWLKNGVSVNSNNVTAPDGLTSADMVVMTAIDETHRLYKSIAITTEDYTVSCFFKPNGVYKKARLFTTGPSTLLSFDLGSGDITIDAGTPIDYGIIDYPDGWKKCWYSYTSSVTSTIAYIYLISETNIGDGVNGGWIWGYQLEKSTYPTSYMKTEAATVTRAIDAATVSNLITNGILSATEGTVQDKRDAISYVSRYTSDGDKEDFVDGVSQGVPAPGAVPASFSLTVPSLTNQVPMYPTPLTNDEINQLN